MSIHSAFMALLDVAPTTTVYDAAVPAQPKVPYVVVSGTIPRVGGRAINRAPQSRQARYRTTAVGLTADSVRAVLKRLEPSLEGARLTVPRYKLGRVEAVPNEQPITEDRDVTLEGLHPLYAVLEWTFIISPA